MPEGGNESVVRPDVYSDNGTWTFRASSLGSCIRGLVAARLGIRPQPPRAWLQGALEESSLAEDLVKVQLMKRGWVVEDGEPVRLELDDGVITGNLDGFIESVATTSSPTYVFAESDRMVLEVKAFGKTLFDGYVRRGLDGLGEMFTRMYGMQVSVYMHATGLPCMMVVYSKESGLTVENVYTEAPFSKDELNNRLLAANWWAEKGEYPLCDAKCSESSWYWHIHEEKPTQQVDDPELEKKFARALELKDTITELKKEYDDLTDEFKEMLPSGTTKAGGYKVSIVRFNQKRTDLDMLRRENGDDFMAAYEYDLPVVRCVPSRKGGKEKKDG